METILLVLQMIIALVLIGLVLIQRSDSDGMGLGGSGGGMGLLSGRAKANALTRATAILAALFMLNSLLFVIITTSGRGSILDRIEAQKPAVAATTDVPRATDDKVPPMNMPSDSSPAMEIPTPQEDMPTVPTETPAPAAEAPANDNQPLSVPQAE